MMAQAAMDRYVGDDGAGRYKLLRSIGKGAYGAVYVAEDTQMAHTTADGSQSNLVAIKHIVNAFVSPTDARRMYREIKVMSHFAHENVLPLLHVLRPREASSFTHIYLVMELMQTDLHRVIHSRQDLTSDHIAYFIYQTLCALKTLHAAGVLHRDLKPSNLLVNGDCSVKMCDFGLARESEPSMSAAFTEYVCTRWYRAPEVLLSGGKYTQAVDVWSVGCVLSELLLRRPMFPGENYLHQLQLITEMIGSPTEADLYFVRSEAARSFMLRLPRFEGIPFTTLFTHVRGPCLDLVARMLTFDPAKRISVEDALAHPFLARVRAARKHINEDPACIPRPFRLRVHGGSTGLRSMSVDAIKARFYAELCGVPLTPTPTAAPSGALFDVAVLRAPAAAAPAEGDAAGAGTPMSDGDEDRPPADWAEGEEDDDEDMYDVEEEEHAPPAAPAAASSTRTSTVEMRGAASPARPTTGTDVHSTPGKSQVTSAARTPARAAHAGVVDAPLTPREAALRSLASAASAPDATRGRH